MEQKTPVGVFPLMVWFVMPLGHGAVKMATNEVPVL
jgi:hypothetical protein